MLIAPLFLAVSVSLFKFDENTFKNDILAEILRVRIPGTVGHDKVKSLISLKWSVEQDEFVAQTPFHKRLLFTNIIATLNPSVTKRFVLACHYDSKYFAPRGNRVFVGATDSAVSCAILIYLAYRLTPYLNTNNNITLQLIFFDGEEAFRQWSEEDSLYGARHLARVFTNTFLKSDPTTNYIKAIDIFILLDLLGFHNPILGCFYKNSSSEFEAICNIERSMFPTSKTKIFYSPTRDKINYYQHTVEDDHKPFVNLGVKVIHIIPLPFPAIWHSFEDDETSIDMESTEKICRILEEYVKQYFQKLAKQLV